MDSRFSQFLGGEIRKQKNLESSDGGNKRKNNTTNIVCAKDASRNSSKNEFKNIRKIQHEISSHITSLRNEPAFVQLPEELGGNIKNTKEYKNEVRRNEKTKFDFFHKQSGFSSSSIIHKGGKL